MTSSRGYVRMVDTTPAVDPANSETGRPGRGALGPLANGESAFFVTSTVNN